MLATMVILALSQCRGGVCPPAAPPFVMPTAGGHLPAVTYSSVPAIPFAPAASVPAAADARVIEDAVKRVAGPLVKEMVERRFAIEREKAASRAGLPEPCQRAGCECGCYGDCLCKDGKRCKAECGCGKDKATAARAPVHVFAEMPPTGLDRSKLDGDGRAFRHVGKRGDRVVTEEEAHRLIEGGDVPDDGHKRRITVIGTQGQRQPVVADLASHPSLTPYRDQYLVQSYPLDDWHVKKGDFRAEGAPTIYVQTADGFVLHRQDSYVGPDALAKVLFRASPDYDPSKDPDLSKPPAPKPEPKPDDKKPAPAPDGGGKKVPVHLYLVAGAVILALILIRKAA